VTGSGPGSIALQVFPMGRLEEARGHRRGLHERARKEAPGTSHSGGPPFIPLHRGSRRRRVVRVQREVGFVNGPVR
jgi:hypothetical protein